MKPINEMKTVILSRSSNESFARVAVSAFIAQIDPTVDEMVDIKTSVSEAVTNCIVHAYGNDLGYIYITVRIFSNDKITVIIKDKGCGIADVQKAMEPMFTTSPGSERAGLGFTVMQSFMSKLRVKSKQGFGTTVIMEKILDRKHLSKTSTEKED